MRIAWVLVVGLTTLGCGAHSSPSLPTAIPDEEPCPTGDVLGRCNVWSVATSADGRLLATGDGSGLIRLWKLRTGRLLRVFRGHGYMRNINDLINQGRDLLTGRGNATAVLDIATGRVNRQYQIPNGELLPLSVSPDGARLAAHSNHKVVHILDLSTGRRLSSLYGFTDWLHLHPMSFPTSDLLVIAGKDGLWAQVWDVRTGRGVHWIGRIPFPRTK